jgi:hypothetical protein
LIRPSEFTNHSDDSCLTKSYKLSNKKTTDKQKGAHIKEDGTLGHTKSVLILALELVDVNVIVDPAYVTEEYPGVRGSIVREARGFSDQVLLVKRQKDWGEYFV